MPQHPDGGKNDTTDYSASKAPETRAEGEEKESTPDARLLPGGAAGSPVDVGMATAEAPPSSPQLSDSSSDPAASVKPG